MPRWQAAQDEHLPHLHRDERHRHLPAVTRITLESQIKPTAATTRAVSPKAQQVAITSHAEALIKEGKLEFTGKAPRKIDVLRQFEVKSVRPFTYNALQLKSGEVVIRQVLTGGFVPARPGDGSYTAPMKFPNISAD